MGASSTKSEWKEVSTSGLAIKLPTDWKTIDLASGKSEQEAEAAFGKDPKFTEIRNQIRMAAQQPMVKLMAFDAKATGSGITGNCNIVIQDMPRPISLEEVADASVQQLSTVVKDGTHPKLEYITLKPGKVGFIRSELKTASTAMPVIISFACVAVKGSSAITITYGGPLANEKQFRETVDQSLAGLRFTN